MLRPAFVNAINLNEAYFQLLDLCWDIGYKYEITEGSSKGEYRLELPFAAGWIKNPHMLPLAPTMPPGVPPTTTDEEIEKYFTTYLMDPELSPNEEYRYSTWINGKYLNKATGNSESQLEYCIRHLKEKGFGNNHCYITIGDANKIFNYDTPYSNETERKTTPCCRGIDVKIKDNKVILGVVFRSWDLYAGFSQNMGGFTLLNQYIANELNVDPGPLTFSSQGLHIYSYQIEAVISYLRK